MNGVGTQDNEEQNDISNQPAVELSAISSEPKPSTSFNEPNSTPMNQEGYGDNSDSSGDENSLLPFTSETKIFKRNGIELLVKKIDFKRQKRFKYDDHHFKIIARVENDGGSNRILDALDTLEDALKFAINELHKKYEIQDKTKNVDRDFYICFNHPQLASGIPLKAYNFKDFRMNDVLADFQSRLERLLNESAENLTFDEMEIFIRVLSKKHMAFINKTVEQVIDHENLISGGGIHGFALSDLPDIHQRSYFLGIPPWFITKKGDRISLDTLCGFFAGIIGIFMEMAKVKSKKLLYNAPKEINKREKKMRQINSVLEETRNLACEEVYKEYLNLKRARKEVGVHPNTNLFVARTLSEHYHCNIILHTSFTNDEITLKWPSKIDTSMPVIHLHYTKLSEKKVHMAVIKHLPKYKENHKLRCEWCNTLMAAKSYM